MLIHTYLRFQRELIARDRTSSLQCLARAVVQLVNDCAAVVFAIVAPLEAYTWPEWDEIPAVDWHLTCSALPTVIDDVLDHNVSRE